MSLETLLFLQKIFRAHSRLGWLRRAPLLHSGQPHLLHILIITFKFFKKMYLSYRSLLNVRTFLFSVPVAFNHRALSSWIRVVSLLKEQGVSQRSDFIDFCFTFPPIEMLLLISCFRKLGTARTPKAYFCKTSDTMFGLVFFGNFGSNRNWKWHLFFYKNLDAKIQNHCRTHKLLL